MEDDFPDGSKPTRGPENPKDMVGVNKAPASCVSQIVMAEVGVGMLEGALKYGRHNYRTVGIRSSIYYDATRRHIDRWWEGQDLDEDSKLSHITKAICSLVVLRDAQIRGMVTDDRPPPTAPVHFRELDRDAQALVQMYPDPPPAHIGGEK